MVLALFFFCLFVCFFLLLFCFVFFCFFVGPCGCSLLLGFGRVSCLLSAQLAFFINLQRAVIGPSATLTGRYRPAIDLYRMLTG